MEQFWIKVVVVMVLAVMCECVTVLAAGDFRLHPTARHIPERGKVASITFLAEGNSYCFIPPAGWRVGSKAAEKRIVLQSRDFAATMELRFLPREDASEGKLSPEILRRVLAARFEYVVPIKEYSWTSSLGDAYGFEMEVYAGRGRPVLRRTIFVKAGNDWLEFSITGCPNRFADYQRAFETWIASVRRQ